MVAGIDERPTKDVWILYDTGSALTVCLLRFQEELRTRNDNGGLTCEAVRLRCGHAVTPGGAREVPMEVSDTNFSFLFRVARVTQPIVSAEGLFQAGCTPVISKIGGCYVITSSGRAITGTLLEKNP